MNYWDGKCFPCLIIGTLVLIVSLSIVSFEPESKDSSGKGGVKDSAIVIER